MNTAKLFLLLVFLTPALCSAADQKLNVLFIAVDDMRPELGCYGGRAKSPNIDKLSSEGLTFDRAYCQFPLCNPSRASLLAGRRPESLDILDLKTNIRKNHPNIVTLPQLFKNAGYNSLCYGKIFHTTNGNHEDLASWSEKPWRPAPEIRKQFKRPDVINRKLPDHKGQRPFGWADCADNEMTDGAMVEGAIKALHENKDQTFFLGMGFRKPHLPFVAPKKYWDMYSEAEITTATNPFTPHGAPEFASNNASELRRYMDIPTSGPISVDDARNLVHGYLACISYIDAQVGKLMAALDDAGLRDNTIVILWGDHGYQLGEHGTWTKRTTWEITARVPLIISYPGQKTRGIKSNALVEFVDIYPTLAEMCALTPPDNLEGTSFAPLLTAPDRPWKSAAFTVYTTKIDGMGRMFARAMRTDRYRFIEWSGPKTDKIFHELYDEINDPDENTNIANKPENQELVKELSEKLKAGWKAARPAE